MAGTRDVFPEGTPVRIELLPIDSTSYSSFAEVDIRCVDTFGVTTTAGVMYPWPRIVSMARMLPADAEMADKMPVLASIVGQEIERLRARAAATLAAKAAATQ